MPQQATMFFPADFRWGTAVSPYQVEGHLPHADWHAWEQRPGTILNDDRSGLACDWWGRGEADLDRAAALGTNALRFGVDWSRIEPEPGRYDEAALARYRELVQGMVARGLEPMVTLHHFTNPLWLVAQGDFSNEAVVGRFQQFTARVVAALGDLVPLWITVNEPMVYIVLRYLETAFPPPRDGRGWRQGMTALVNLLRCHAAAYHTIKAAYPQAQVGVAKQIRPIHVPRGGWPARLLAGRLDYIFNRLWLDAMADGRVRFPAGRGRIANLAGSADFIGINYYTYSNVAWPPTRQLYDNRYPPDAIIGDGNYGEVYPAGLFEAIKMALPYRKPIFITENGMPDADDSHRPWFLLAHLREAWRAISFNYPVMGYYHWSLVDNFEWERGWTQRFGLYALDPATQQRTLRRSGELYREMATLNGISHDQAVRYAPDQLETIFR
jgi:beta-glucosidase